MVAVLIAKDYNSFYQVEECLIHVATCIMSAIIQSPREAQTQMHAVAKKKS